MLVAGVNVFWSVDGGMAGSEVPGWQSKFTLMMPPWTSDWVKMLPLMASGAPG